MKVLHKTRELLVVEKPAGLSIYPSRGGEESLAGQVRHYLSGPFFFVHRLDKGTSGLLLVARTTKMAEHLKRLFRRRLVKKEYLAWVSGRPGAKRGRIHLPLLKEAKLKKVFPSRAPRAKWAETRFEVESLQADKTLLRLWPKTGRTHQIRVHLAAIGHPVIGDVTYGGPMAERLYLHAHRLTFKDPNGQLRDYTSVLPKDFHA